MKVHPDNKENKYCIQVNKDSDKDSFENKILEHDRNSLDQELARDKSLSAGKGFVFGNK